MPFDEQNYRQLRQSMQNSGVARDVLIGHTVFYKETTETTMIDSLEGVAAGASSGSVFVAGQQLAGRGRKGRSFVSAPDSGLWATTYYELESMKQANQVTMVAALAVRDAVELTSGLQADIKWPNDILVRSKKLAGILPDLQVTGDHATVHLGTGINIRTPETLPTEVRDIATSIHGEGYSPPSIEELLACLTYSLEVRHVQSSSAPDQLWEEWSENLVTIGRRIRLSTPNGDVTGIAETVTNSGELILRTDEGSRESYSAGEVHTIG